MSESIKEAILNLQQAAQTSDDEDYSEINEVSFIKVDKSTLEDSEKRLGFDLPPSYKRFVLEHGVFRIGSSGYEHMSFRLLEPKEVVTIHAHLARSYAASTSAEIATKMGVDESLISVTKLAAAFALQGDEDYWTFDSRSQNETNGECKVVGLLLEDGELEYFAEQTDYSDNDEFETFILDLIARRKDGDFD